jgi:predicted dehydrogenase
MAIAHPFAIDVKAFSAAYGELRHSVNAATKAETRLKDFGWTGAESHVLEADCIARASNAILPGERVKAFSGDRLHRLERSMVERTVRVIMNGVTGRMGYRQHLVRSILAIRDDGGVSLPDGDRITVEPILVGRNAEKLATLAAEHGVADFTTNLDEALTDGSASIYFDAQVTSERRKSILKAIGAGKHIYTEKPIAESVPEGSELVDAAREAGVINGVVHDKLYLPGLIKLKRLIDSGFFGRILSVRGEFGYWVFEGDLQPAQRPSWNYRAEDGGGMVLDMFPHWNYVLENLFGRVQAVTAKAVTHIPDRWDEQGRKYHATADDAAYAIFELDGNVIAQVNSSWAVRVDRGELVEFQVDGTDGSAVAGLFGCRIQPRVETPMPVWNPDLPTTEDFRSQWHQIPDNAEFTNGFRAQWEQFLSDVDAGRAHAYDLAAGVRGLQLAEAGLESSAKGARVAIDWFES